MCQGLVGGSHGRSQVWFVARRDKICRTAAMLETSKNTITK